MNKVIKLDGFIKVTQHSMQGYNTNTEWTTTALIRILHAFQFHNEVKKPQLNVPMANVTAHG